MTDAVEPIGFQIAAPQNLHFILDLRRADRVIAERARLGNPRARPYARLGIAWQLTALQQLSGLGAESPFVERLHELSVHLGRVKRHGVPKAKENP
jgi:hypothetical protein